MCNFGKFIRRALSISDPEDITTTATQEPESKSDTEEKLAAALNSLSEAQEAETEAADTENAKAAEAARRRQRRASEPGAIMSFFNPSGGSSNAGTRQLYGS